MNIPTLKLGKYIFQYKADIGWIYCPPTFSVYKIIDYYEPKFDKFSECVMHNFAEYSERVAWFDSNKIDLIESAIHNVILSEKIDESVGIMKKNEFLHKCSEYKEYTHSIAVGLTEAQSKIMDMQLELLNKGKI